MGFTTDRLPDPYALSDICSVTFLAAKTNSLPLILHERGGQLIFGEEVPCDIGFMPKSLGGEKWFRNEIGIDRPDFPPWEPKSYQLGQLVRHNKKYLQCISQRSAPDFDPEDWRAVQHRPYLILCQRPRQSRSKVVLFRFRVGVKRSRRIRHQQVLDWKENFYRTLPAELSIGHLMTLTKSHLIERYESEERDWSYGDDRQLRAGFHLPIEDEVIRRDFAGVVMGITFLPESEKVPADALDTLVASVWRSEEIVREQELATESCIPTRKPTQRYRFWPRCVPAQPGWKLFEDQYQTIDREMEISIKQALCGPDKADIAPGNDDFWTGRAVSNLAKAIFRTRMFSQWKNCCTERGETLPHYISSVNDELELGYQQFY